MGGMDTKTGERIGLLGGTFNPIHEGHIRAAREVRRAFDMDRVLLVPSFIPPHKGSGDVAAPEHRLLMAREAVRDFPGIEVSPVEIEAGGRSYSVRTLEIVRRLHPGAEIYFILGIDAFLEIETWMEYRRLLESCRMIVISRPGFRLEDAWNVLGEDFRPRICRWRGPGALGRDEAKRYTIFLLEMEALDVSSSEIRERLRSGRPVSGLLSPAVAEYIKENGLYRRNHE